MVATINAAFIPIQHDASEGYPLPGQELYRRSWRENPWTRVSAGTEYVLEPGGAFLLSVGRHGHTSMSRSEALRLTTQEALERLEALRETAPGSRERAAAREALSQTLAEEYQTHHCRHDRELFFEHSMSSLVRYRPDRFEQKMSGVFTSPEPAVRRGALESVQQFTLTHDSDPRFNRRGGMRDYFTLRIAPMRNDPDASVRQAAEQTLMTLSRASVSREAP